MRIKYLPDLPAQRDEVATVEPDRARPHAGRSDHSRGVDRVVGIEQEYSAVSEGLRVAPERCRLVRKCHHPRMAHRA